MRSRLGWLRAHLWGLVVGAVVTAATAGSYRYGTLEPFSLKLLDVKFRRANPIEADDRIVLIDINDYAVENVHKWPWPRRIHADLVNTLRELGAEAILMDLVFDAPEFARVVHPRLNPDYEFDDLRGLADEVNVSDAVWDDDEFGDALADAGNVYLGMFAGTYEPQYFPNDVRRNALKVLNEGASAPSLEAFDARVRSLMPEGVDWMSTGSGRAAEQRDRAQLFERWRVEHLLETEFALTERDLASRLGLTKEQVARHFAPAKRDVAHRLAARFRRANTDADWPATLAHILPGASLDVETPDLWDLRRAFRFVSSERYALDAADMLHPSLIGKIRNAADFTLPYWKLASAARAGLVVFDVDAADGVMRRVPLVANDRGRLVEHLGFALARDVLDVDKSSIRLEDRNILAMRDRSGNRDWRIQLDSAGRTLINWHTDDEDPGKWERSFKHIPVASVLRIPTNRRYIEQAQGYETGIRARFVDASTSGAGKAYEDYARRVKRLKALRWQAISGESPVDLAKLEAEVRAIEQDRIDSVAGDAEAIREYLSGEGDESELDPAERNVLELAGNFDTAAIARQTTQTVSRRQAEIDGLLKQLRSDIEGKICLVGYTATAVADTVNTPVFDEVPGVMAHANVINSMLLDRFPRSMPRWFDLLLIIAVGLPVTFVTTWRGPAFSLLMMLLFLSSLWVIAFHLFDRYTLHIDIVGPLVAAFLAWAFVTLYRQLTEERQKRAFSKSLAQYTSPAIAAKLAEQLSRQSGALDLSPRAQVVTCFFSDLKGFTSISERLGASRTRDVLNPYLEAMSDVLIRSEAMINKFMGDGIFAFYNPPLLPVEHHARAACEATLNSFVALQELKNTLAEGDLGEEVRGLSMRIGVNTGEVFVGDYGSSNKLDYTCIGDTVNLSARLEPACKPFGIAAMISESTLEAAGDGYVVRHLGSLQVVGKKVGVPVYELIGREGEVEIGVVEYAALFGEAVLKFQNRDWEGALRAIAQCRKSRADDPSLDLLDTNVRQRQASPPPDDWNQAIELTSK